MVWLFTGPILRSVFNNSLENQAIQCAQRLTSKRFQSYALQKNLGSTSHQGPGTQTLLTLLSHNKPRREKDITSGLEELKKLPEVTGPKPTASGHTWTKGGWVWKLHSGRVHACSVSELVP